LPVAHGLALSTPCWRGVADRAAAPGHFSRCWLSTAC
jgi:hypothetical protein